MARKRNIVRWTTIVLFIVPAMTLLLLSESRTDERVHQASRVPIRANSDGSLTQPATGEDRTEKNDIQHNRRVDQLRDRLDRMRYARNIDRAYMAWQQGDPADAWRRLNACRGDLRGWEHDYLFTLFTHNQVKLKTESHVYSIAFTPDGKRIVSGRGSDGFDVWDAESGREVLSVELKNETTTNNLLIRISPDEKRIFSTNTIDGLHIVDAASGRLLAKLRDRQQAAVSPNGRQIAAVESTGKSIGLLDAKTGKEIRKLNGRIGNISELSFSLDGKRVVAVDTEGVVTTWSARTGRVVKRFKISGESVYGAAFSLEADRVVVTDFDQRATVWNTKSGKKEVALRGQRGNLSCVAFGSDGKRIVGGGDDRHVFLWDATTGKLLRRFKGHDDSVASVAISPDGRRIASGGTDSTVRIWQTDPPDPAGRFKGLRAPFAISRDGKKYVSRKGELLTVRDAITGRRLAMLKGFVHDLMFSPDGRRIAGVSHGLFAGGEVTLWDSASGKVVRKIETPDHHLAHNAAFSPDGKVLAFSAARWRGRGGRIKVCDAETGKTIHELTDGACVAFGPGGKWFAGTVGDNVLIWDTKTGRVQRTIKDAGDGGFSELTISPDGKSFASTDIHYNTINVRDMQSGKLRLVLEGHRDFIRSVIFSPDGRRIISGSDDRTIRIWDASSGEELLVLRGHLSGVSRVSFMPDGKGLISQDHQGNVKVWDASRRQKVRTLVGGVVAVFSPDGKRLATQVGDEVQLLDPVSGRILLTLEGKAGSVGGLAFTSDGKRIAGGGIDHTLKIWDAVTGKRLHTLKGHKYHVNCVAFSRDGKRVVSGGGDDTIRIWDAKSGRELRTLRGHGSILNRVLISPNGNWIASASDDHTIKLWDFATGKLLRTLKGHTKDVEGLAFSPDGKQIASGGADNVVKVWDPKSGRLIRTMKGHTSFVYGVAYSPNGKWLASVAWDGTGRVWDAATGRHFRTLRRHNSYVYDVTFSPDSRQVVTSSDNLKLWNLIGTARELTD